ncbi:MAG TPA: VanZ family protein [Candidatus Polarisedimenticolia bacterium]|nr:VanZ family protein [Candidatus Polarisedimenticolia bacterium]
MSRSGVLHVFWVWGPLFAYAGIIFYLSSQSQVGWARFAPDYVEHAMEYGGLALLVARALNDGLATPVPRRRLLLAFLACLAYGVADEIHQWFVPDRFADYTDVLSDATGAALALGALRLVQSLRRKGA